MTAFNSESSPTKPARAGKPGHKTSPAAVPEPAKLARPAITSGRPNPARRSRPVRLSKRVRAKAAGPGRRRLDYWLSLSLYLLLPAPIALLIYLTQITAWLGPETKLILAYIVSSPQALVYALAMSQARRHAWPLWLRLLLSAFGGALSGAAMGLLESSDVSWTLIGLISGLLSECLVSLALACLVGLRAKRPLGLAEQIGKAPGPELRGD